MNTVSTIASATIAALILAYGFVSARAQEIDSREVQAVADKVGLVLKLHGFDKVRTDWPLPPARIVDLRNGHSGETDGVTILIDSRAPEACRERILAHELAHVIVAKAYGAVRDAEGIARAVESVVSPDYMPNC